MAYFGWLMFLEIDKVRVFPAVSEIIVDLSVVVIVVAEKLSVPVMFIFLVEASNEMLASGGIVSSGVG